MSVLNVKDGYRHKLTHISLNYIERLFKLLLSSLWQQNCKPNSLID